MSESTLENTVRGHLNIGIEQAEQARTCINNRDLGGAGECIDGARGRMLAARTDLAGINPAAVREMRESLRHGLGYVSTVMANICRDDPDGVYHRTNEFWNAANVVYERGMAALALAGE